MKFRWAWKAFKKLDGIFCIYKPKELRFSDAQRRIKQNLLRDLNALPCYEFEKSIHDIESNKRRTVDEITSNLPITRDVPDVIDVSENRLVLGRRYIESDIELFPVAPLQKHSSGVIVMGVGRAVGMLPTIARAKYMRVYHIRGRFGWATDNFSPKGKIIERTSFSHITKPKLDKICAVVQSNHMKLMFKYAGVKDGSQEAYELASKGLIRPESKDTPPVIYGVHCIEYNLPDFTLEIHSINERKEYFMNLIHELGLQLKSTAVCTQVRRVRFGHFTLDHALVQDQWNLYEIINNFDKCHPELHPDKLLIGSKIDQAKSHHFQIEDGENKNYLLEDS
ncbi:hypothetical protein LOTGIDRAFT_222302 [Lottia gigantea]|uniref:Pseudouridine synthase II N-terminal domain-containing protein n=1 Tax=Lottia gigantea TaxID=225164 RepID=V3ZI54_LOTGI|nr:hypothetical protein LOTGIDRAFT_222302 [Lottia gigantea]ESO83872.1 hypothetical protein LOTGIDRAFT_222302 [Lottia gigantea]